jgi:hypothetical protein
MMVKANKPTDKKLSKVVRVFISILLTCKSEP